MYKIKFSLFVDSSFVENIRLVVLRTRRKKKNWQEGKEVGKLFIHYRNQSNERQARWNREWEIQFAREGRKTKEIKWKKWKENHNWEQGKNSIDETDRNEKE